MLSSIIPRRRHKKGPRPEQKTRSVQSLHYRLTTLVDLQIHKVRPTFEQAVSGGVAVQGATRDMPSPIRGIELPFPTALLALYPAVCAHNQCPPRKHWRVFLLTKSGAIYEPTGLGCYACSVCGKVILRRPNSHSKRSSLISHPDASEFPTNSSRTSRD